MANVHRLMNLAAILNAQPPRQSIHGKYLKYSKTLRKEQGLAL